VHPNGPVAPPLELLEEEPVLDEELLPELLEEELALELLELDEELELLPLELDEELVPVLLEEELVPALLDEELVPVLLELDDVMAPLDDDVGVPLEDVVVALDEVAPPPVLDEPVGPADELRVLPAVPEVEVSVVLEPPLPPLAVPLEWLLPASQPEAAARTMAPHPA
jgi:hypothetical protein